jgi:hypothetical protein
MAETSLPFSTSPVATEAQWSSLIGSLGMVDGVDANDPTGTVLKVTANGTSTLSIAEGEAMVNGFYYNNSAVLNKTVPNNAGGTSRIDRVVLRCSQTANSVVVTYLTGGSSAPTIANDRDDIFDIPLAKITVPAGTASVPPGNVVDERWFRGKGVASSLSAYRRPAYYGQIIIEGPGTDPNIYMGSGANSWTQLFPVLRSAATWTVVSFATGWENLNSGDYADVAYTKLANNMVKIRGNARASSDRPNDSRIFTLPSGFRPGSREVFQNSSSDTDYTTSPWTGRVDVLPNGEVHYYSEMSADQWVSLSNVFFQAV